MIEIFAEKDKRIFSSARNYEELTVYNKVCDSRVHWKDLNIPCNSKNDLYVVVSHVRAGLGSKMLQSKLITSIRICSVQFNLTMERKTNVGTQILKFNLIDLDSIEEVDRYPAKFHLQFELDFTDLGKFSSSANFFSINSIALILFPLSLSLPQQLMKKRNSPRN